MTEIRKKTMAAWVWEKVTTHVHVCTKAPEQLASNERFLVTCTCNFYSPAFTTAFVCSEVPEAMFVKAQAASNWREGLQNKEQIINQQYITWIK